MFALPSFKPTVPKIGLEFSNSDVKTKFYAFLRSGVVEHSLTAKASSDISVGYDLTVNPSTQTLDKYDFGLAWSPAFGSFVGLKHVSGDQAFPNIGRFFIYSHHVSSSTDTVGTEFSLDWQSREVRAQLGLNHKFNDDTNGKFKLDQDGLLSFVLKHKLNSSVTAGVVVPGVDLTRLAAQQKLTQPALGFSLDLKL